jgi:tRNA nucleotidyltransferase (CCA-adding enzyme)
MKIYLVGGAVRDKLLNYPVVEKDWVVVGATPEEMLQKGFRQVGRDFPVFLHPESREEYALARKEKKSGHGYHGFDCDFDKEVSLEDDLERRDLTINAMAMDESGQIIDPYQGLQDLKAKKLRHVSQAFVEDPVRVLRVARFAARYHHLGFTLAEETRAMMYDMACRGELMHLVPERVWQEFERALSEKNPEVFITTLRACGALQIILPEIDKLFGVPAPAKYHPEIDSGVHTLMVLQATSQKTRDPMLRFAALIHDLGKAETPITEWPSHRSHEHRGEPIIESLCMRLRVPTEWRTFAMMVCRQHLNIHRIDAMRANTIVSLFEATDAFRKKERFLQMLIVCEADRLREEVEETNQAAQTLQTKKWSELLEACFNIDAKELVAAGFQGVAIKNELHKRRVALVRRLMKPKLPK